MDSRDRFLRKNSMEKRYRNDRRIHFPIDAPGIQATVDHSEKTPQVLEGQGVDLSDRRDLE